MKRLKELRRSKVFQNEIVGTFVLLGAALLLVFGLQFALMAVLGTNYPLHAVVSGSMIPALRVGDLVILRGVQNACEINAAPETGDIIVFRSHMNPKEFIIHRAIEKYNTGDQWLFRTKGDNNFMADPIPVPESSLIGKVVGPKIPLVGYVKIYLGTPIGMTAIIVLIFLLLFMDYIPRPTKKEEV